MIKVYREGCGSACEYAGVGGVAGHPGGLKKRKGLIFYDRLPGREKGVGVRDESVMKEDGHVGGRCKELPCEGSGR